VSRQPVSAPYLLVTIGFERSAPHVIASCMNDRDEARLWDWIHAKPRLAEIVRLAIELEQEERAA